MKKTNKSQLLALLISAAAFAASGPATAGEVKVTRTITAGGDADKDKAEGDEQKKTIVIKRIEAPGEEGEAKERTWIGVGLGEPDEALVAQLGLKDGAGLVVTHVAENSPAAKAGLQKNDVLLEMEGQSLVVAQQLQKLVKARKEGDKVTVKYLRAGKKDSVTVTLGKTKDFAMNMDSGGEFEWRAASPDTITIHDSGGGSGGSWASAGAPGDHVIMLQDALKGAKLDQKRVQVEVRRSLDEARKAIAVFIHDYNHFWLIERLGYR